MGFASLPERLLIHLRIQPRHRRRIPQPLRPLARRRSQLLATLRILQHPADRCSQRLRLKRLGQRTGAAIDHDGHKAGAEQVVL